MKKVVENECLDSGLRSAEFFRKGRSRDLRAMKYMLSPLGFRR